MKKIIFVYLILFTSILFSQRVPKKFSQLSCPIKTWVIFHPFKAKRAQLISIEANQVSDSIKNTNILDGDASGGQVDAFRHAYWMARLRQEIGKCAAKSLGKAHERENKQTYKKSKLEDGVLPDEISSEMDLFNNKEGLKLTTKRDEIKQKTLIYKVLNAILEGKMKIIKKDEEGNFLSCDGRLISATELKGKWENEKCLIPSVQSIE